MFCRFSHLKKTRATTRSSMAAEDSTGVRTACGLTRSWAAAISEKVTLIPNCRMAAMDYSSYQDLKIRLVEPGILEIVMGEEGKLATATARAHGEMARIWLDVDRDPQVSVAILRGAGKGFSAGREMAMVEDRTNDFAARARVWREARDLVYNMLNCSKIIVSA